HPAPLPQALGRGQRIRAPPQKYRDFATTSAIPFDIPMFGQAVITPPHSPSPGASPVPLSLPSQQRQGILEISQWRKSRPNGFGLYKLYWSLEERPHDPDLFLSNLDLDQEDDQEDGQVSQDVLPSRSSSESLQGERLNPYYPFPNWTAKLWAEDGASWKAASVTVDVPFNSASASPGPKPFTFENFRFRPLVPIILSKLQDKSAMEHFHVVPSEIWWDRGRGRDHVRVHGELYHSNAFLDAYREVQTLSPAKQEDHLPRFVVALMFASDETHLTSFGDAQLWPAYMHFGNDSKYRRAKTSLKLFEEVAFFQKLPDSFVDWYLQRSEKKTIPDELLRHVRRELFQAQWDVLLDDEFLRAYEHGLAVDCGDGVRRRFYPRILTYGADYPERMKVVGVRSMGEFPCARCLVSVADIPQMGTATDHDIRVSRRRVDDNIRKNAIHQARGLIYGKNYAVDADKVEDLLKPTSLVPSKNAFSERLSSHGLDVYDIPAVDILHEVEIGVWKSLFIHLLRLLEAIPGTGQGSVLNSRFRQIPAFGRDTIRRFRHDVSAMKQLGARDFEDLLQCAPAAFEGLFPPGHDDRVQDLLFTLALWHALAKLRMHTDSSLELLDSWTSLLGEAARTFVKLTCSQFRTQELKSEYEARKRKEARASRKGAGTQEGGKQLRGPGDGLPREGKYLLSSLSPRPIPGPLLLEYLGPMVRTIAELCLSFAVILNTTIHFPGRKARGWSLSTPKYHSLGDVVSYIKRNGTTDSYSTQLSERYHRFPKSRYRRTNKKGVSRQISRIQTRQARIKRLRNQIYPSPDEGPPLQVGMGNTGYFVGKSQNQPVNISHFLRLNGHDPAVENFLVKLKVHLFPRIVAALIREVSLNPENYPDRCSEMLAALSSEPSERDIDSIYFHSDTMYRHNVLQVQYTTYDCRPDFDTINPNTSRKDFMCHSLPAQELSSRPEASGPQPGGSSRYVYGRVLGIFHANVVYGGSGSLDYRRRRFDFLWVRWYTPLSDEEGGSSLRLDRLKLAPMSESDSWGFLDPSEILRGAHIIPRFAKGKAHEKVSSQGRIFSKAAQEQLDWEEYYINRFVDRDMAMRFHGEMAVGHIH
ncbi:hypothetical protein FA13DRAFT_1571092, partial [Coprinellus micaceus]